jgi:phosphoribosylglycinamide formyltransferase-1
VSSLVNLIVDLDERSMRSPSFPQTAIELPSEVCVAPPSAADDRTLAWIDELFSGTWSSEAFVGSNVVARRAGMPIGFATLDPKGLRFAWLGGVAREPGVGIFGPFGLEPAERKTGLGRELLRRALGGLRERDYTRALIPAIGDERLARYYADSIGARVVERFERSALLRPARRTLVMASGNGSNFQAVVEAAQSGALPIEVVALLTNNRGAYVVERARDAGLGSIHIVPWNREEESRAAYDARLLEVAASEKPDLILLLGWMHLLGDTFVQAFPHMFNLHPAFLPLDPERDEVTLPDGTQMPALRGPRAVRDALAISSRWIGATIHHVTPATDRGPVLARKPLRVEPGESEADLEARLHAVEHRLVRAGVTRWLYERDELAGVVPGD